MLSAPLNVGWRGRQWCVDFNISKGSVMKKLFPLERFSSLGGVEKVAAIVAAASLSCLPFSSALANHTGDGGGGHPSGGGGGHPSGGGGDPGGGGRGALVRAGAP